VDKNGVLNIQHFFNPKTRQNQHKFKKPDPFLADFSFFSE